MIWISQVRFFPLGLIAMWTAICAGTTRAGETAPLLSLDADYPGGNIIVESMEGDVVRLRQDLRDTAGWWFWWNFRVRNGVDRTVTFQFAGQSPIGVRGPAVSLDGGKSWKWLGSDAVTGNAFRYTFGENSGEVRFAFAMPYQRQNLDQFITSHVEATRRGRLILSTLCQSRKGRDVPLVRVRATPNDVERRVLLTARHHACETMANYVLEGVLDAVLSTANEFNRPWQDVEIFAVPLVDYDGVQDGDQGKNRKPHDHNRDYGSSNIGPPPSNVAPNPEGDRSLAHDTGIYPETAAIRRLVEGWPSGSLQVAIDLHCPWIRGQHNDVIYMVGSSSQGMAAEQQRFGTILQDVCEGSLRYRLSDNIPFGTAWNTTRNYTQGKSFGLWASEQSGVRMAAAFEIPYAEAGGVAVTPESARVFGRDLAQALKRYLAEQED